MQENSAAIPSIVKAEACAMQVPMSLLSKKNIEQLSFSNYAGYIARKTKPYQLAHDVIITDGFRKYALYREPNQAPFYRQDSKAFWVGQNIESHQWVVAIEQQSYSKEGELESISELNAEKARLMDNVQQGITALVSMQALTNVDAARLQKQLLGAHYLDVENAITLALNNADIDLTFKNQLYHSFDALNTLLLRMSLLRLNSRQEAENLLRAGLLLDRWQSFCFMPFFFGERLDLIIKKRAEYSTAQLKEMVILMLQALQQLQATSQLIHRNITPDNLIFDMASSKVHFTGFRQAISEKAQQVAPVASITPYQAPEVKETFGWSVAADNYAIGSVALELLTGQYQLALADVNAIQDQACCDVIIGLLAENPAKRLSLSEALQILSPRYDSNEAD